ncbi:glucosaminidase domain-containing protein [Paenibacillus sp. N1-5-1-14]|uniref:glucosaminidase domain-containing protein n=1 Tax=Paenibacillus radicibacter TaxID=2972488 RepID=UPI00215933C0|nr:glucosaminidase domain-containing protein [Paenibacillus radicibacter]MCR8641994.1 glucosaminidase domain-containing protein [Paenibacillus radicibacter]
MMAIMGTAKATAEQMVSYSLKAYSSPKLPNCTIQQLAQMFIEEGQAEGVRGDIAWAQSLQETGYFRYGGAVLPSQNNYAGIGAVNSGATSPATFSSPRIGVRAQIQHLKAYASTVALNQAVVDPRFGYVTRGTAPYVEWLGAADNPNGTGWAYPGAGYGASIIAMLSGVLSEPK